MTSEQLLDSVLQLPEAERLLIASRILETLPDQIAAEEIDEDEFLAELQRRSGDWQGAVSWQELRDSLQNPK